MKKLYIALVAVLPWFAVVEGAASTLYFPDYVVGSGWSVQLALGNIDPAAAAEVVVEVYDQDGAPIHDLFESGSAFEIPPLGSRVLRSAGEGSLRRGWIQVRNPSATIRGLLTYRHAETGIEVGVEPVPLGKRFALFVEDSADVGTGLAIFKPQPGARIEFDIRDQAGRNPLEEVLTRGDFQQRVGTIPEWYEGVGGEFLGDFRGLLFLRAVDGASFAPLGLRGVRRTGSLSAVPVVPLPDPGRRQDVLDGWVGEQDPAGEPGRERDGRPRHGIEQCTLSGAGPRSTRFIDVGPGRPGPTVTMSASPGSIEPGQSDIDMVVHQRAERVDHTAHRDGPDIGALGACSQLRRPPTA